MKMVLKIWYSDNENCKKKKKLEILVCMKRVFRHLHCVKSYQNDLYVSVNYSGQKLQVCT